MRTSREQRGTGDTTQLKGILMISGWSDELTADRRTKDEAAAKHGFS